MSLLQKIWAQPEFTPSPPDTVYQSSREEANSLLAQQIPDEVDFVFPFCIFIWLILHLDAGAALCLSDVTYRAAQTADCRMPTMASISFRSFSLETSVPPPMDSIKVNPKLTNVRNGPTQTSCLRTDLSNWK